MIIQCKQCRTKFRFDDAQIVDDGLWMRCSRCQHVFFQENPMKMSRAGASPVSPDFPQGSVPEKTASRLAFEPAGVTVGRNVSDKNIDNLPQEMMAEEKKTGDAVKTKSEPAVKEDNIFTDIEFSPGPGNLDETDKSRELTEKGTPPPVHKKNRVWMVAIWTILVIVVVPAILYFFVFPQLGERYVKLGEHGVRIVLNVFGVAQPMEGHSVAGLVKLQDIRQRFLDNYIMGNKIRIVEGLAVNQADYSVARILIKGTILDAYAVVKGERVIYAGNVLTDEELANLSEGEIAQRLALPSGRNNLNERVIPNGRVPFMIVFTSEPPGVIKTTVKAVNAERLL
jgi:predicted Zn finger-like uncharacterized protein